MKLYIPFLLVFSFFCCSAIAQQDDTFVAFVNPDEGTCGYFTKYTNTLLPGRHYYFDSDNDGLGDINKPISYIEYDGGTPNTLDKCYKLSQSSSGYIHYVNYTNGPSETGKYVANYHDCDDSVFNNYQRLFIDVDGDGYGSKTANPFHYIEGCNTVPAGVSYVTNDMDCNDNDPLIIFDPIVWYRDADSDGYGNPSETILTCKKRQGYVKNNLDCNDSLFEVTTQGIPWYADFDADGFGDPSTTIISCSQPTNYVVNFMDQWCPNEFGVQDGCPDIQYDFGSSNYSYTRVYLNGFKQLELDNSSDNDVIESIVYYDNIGRPKQSIAINAGGNSEDLVTPHIYDEIGRKTKSYLPLPVSSNNGGYYSGNIFSEVITYYKNKFPDDFYQGTPLYPDWDNPFSHIRFDNSPLSRVQENSGPGYDWKLESNSDTDHTNKYEYEMNGDNSVLYFSVNYTSSQDTSLNYNGMYAENELSKVVTKDENWQPSDGEFGTITEYYDKFGRLVLERKSVFDSDLGTQDLNYHDTYFVFDDFGNLLYMLSPEASEKILDVNGTIIQSVLNELGFQYKFDYRNRLVEKKLPGKGWEYILYDSMDRPVLVQDAVLRNDSNKWLFTKYDYQGRVVYTGIYTPPAGLTKQQIENEFNGPQTINETSKSSPTLIGGTDVYYTNFAFPSQNLEVHTVNYYDSYIDYFPTVIPDEVLGQPVSMNIQGLPTVSKVRVLGSDQWITTLFAYDNKSRNIYGDAHNEYLASREIFKNLLDFTGKELESESQHIKTGNQTIVTKDYYTYDHLGRLKSHKQKIDNEEAQLIAQKGYDELGQYTGKSIGGTTLVDGYTDLNEVEISSDGVITSTNTNGWNPAWASYVKTKGEIPSSFDGGIDFIVSQDDKHIRGGLVSASNANLSNGYFDYGIHLHTGGVNNSEIKIKLVIEGDISTDTGLSYTAGDLFRIKRVGNNVEFWHNNTNFHTENGDINGNEIEELALVGKVNFSGPPGGSIENLSLFSSGTNFKLQNIDYKYNIHGWLTDINDIEASSGFGPSTNNYNDLYNFRINYNNVDGSTGAIPLYNGNISQTFWKTDNEDKDLRAYLYKYDNLNRIKDGLTFKGNNLSSLAGYNYHNLTDVKYDRNGNILNLDRLGTKADYQSSGQWDSLEYSYEANKLLNVTDNSNDPTYQDFGFRDGNVKAITGNNDYEYDLNGNMINDLNKDIINITYNHLNLPTLISIDDFNGTSGTINYTYDANGIKLSKSFIAGGINSSSQVTQYAGNFIYQQNGNGNNVLQFFTHAEGYVEPTPVFPDNGEISKSIKKYDIDTGQTTYSAYKYIFQYKDNIGNVRLSFADNDGNGSIDSSSEIIKESNFYPFGLKHAGYNNDVSSLGNYFALSYRTFQGQEIHEEVSLDLHSFKWRFHDAAIGRFIQIDPLSEKYQYNSTYAFAENRVIDGFELEGLEWIDDGWEDIPDYRTLDETVIFYKKNPDDWHTEADQTGHAGTYEQWLEENPEFSPIPEIGRLEHEERYGNEHRDWEGKKVKADRAKEMMLFADVTFSGMGGGGTVNIAPRGQMVGRLFRGGGAFKPKPSAKTTSPKTEKVDPKSLQPTHALDKSKNAFKKLLEGIKAKNAVTESIKYTVQGNTRYIVDGHHRVYISKRIGLDFVPAERVSLPYGQYNTVQDLMFTGKNPGYLNYIKF